MLKRESRVLHRGSTSSLGHAHPDLYGWACGVYGNASRIWGRVTGLRGGVDGLTGDVTGLRGNAWGVYGHCTGLTGDLDDCGLTPEQRAAGVDILTLIGD